MSFFTMAFMGMTPFGSLGAGYMANPIGVRETLLLVTAAFPEMIIKYSMRLQRRFLQ